MFITHYTLSGLIEAEGCFSVYFYTRKLANGKTNVTASLDFIVISQLDLQVVKSVSDYLLTTYGLSASQRFTSGVNQLTYSTKEQFKQIVFPMIRGNYFFTQKWMDAQLFAECFNCKNNTSQPKYVNDLEIAHLMFAMNWKGVTRKLTLAEYEKVIGNFFPNVTQFEKARHAAKQKVQDILKRPFPTLNLSVEEIEEYFIGMFAGDGHISIYSNRSNKRNAILSVEIGISLKKAEQNVIVLDHMAKSLQIVWTHVKHSTKRNAVRVRNSQKNNYVKTLKGILEKHHDKLPDSKLKQVKALTLYDEIAPILSGGNRNFTSDQRNLIKKNLRAIYAGDFVDFVEIPKKLQSSA
jgi:hypothetical protein